MPFSSPAEKHINVDNELFVDGVTQWDFQENSKTATGAAKQRYAMNQRGILVGYNSTDADSNYVTIDGYLVSEGEDDRDIWPLAVGVVHPLRFARIYRSANTTGRRIKVVGS